MSDTYFCGLVMDHCFDFNSEWEFLLTVKGSNSVLGEADICGANFRPNTISYNPLCSIVTAQVGKRNDSVTNCT